MTIAEKTSAAMTVDRQEVVVCRLCGTRLRPDDAGVSYTNHDELVTLANHRCVPRVRWTRQ